MTEFPFIAFCIQCWIVWLKVIVFWKHHGRSATTRGGVNVAWKFMLRYFGLLFIKKIYLTQQSKDKMWTAVCLKSSALRIPKFYLLSHLWMCSSFTHVKLREKVCHFYALSIMSQSLQFLTNNVLFCLFMSSNLSLSSLVPEQDSSHNTNHCTGEKIYHKPGTIIISFLWMDKLLTAGWVDWWDTWAGLSTGM